MPNRDIKEISLVNKNGTLITKYSYDKDVAPENLSIFSISASYQKFLVSESKTNESFFSVFFKVYFFIWLFSEHEIDVSIRHESIILMIFIL